MEGLPFTDNKRPGSVRTVGIIVAAFSAMALFGNSMGALMAFAFGFGNPPAGEDPSMPLSPIFAHYLELCLVMVAMAGANLVGGIFLQRYKLWASRLVTGLSVLQIAAIWTVMVWMYNSMGRDSELGLFHIWIPMTAAVWTVPFVLLIWFLRRKENEGAFE